MKTRAYHKGRRFEYRVKREFERRGYVVFRLAGSKPFDLIALNKREVIFIECRMSKLPSRGEIDKIKELAEKAGAKAKIVTPDKEIDVEV